MPNLGNLEEQSPDEPYPGVRRVVVDGSRATLVRYTFDPGAGFPRHEHEEEQITLVESGSAEFTIDGATHPLETGDWVVVEGGVVHGLTAGPAGVRVLSVIAPRRARRDAYRVVSAT